MGYIGQSMSERAAEAYGDGAVPLSKITSKWLRDHGIGCTRAELLDLIAVSEVYTTEWHHTGKYFGMTNFYRPGDLRDKVAALTPEQIAEARVSAKAARAAEQAGEVHRNCTVDWLVWYGKGVRPDENHAEGATVLVKGSFAEVTLRDGTWFRKRVDATGFKFEDAKHRRERERREAEMRRREKKFWGDIERRFLAAAAGKRIERLNGKRWEPLLRKQVREWLCHGRGWVAERAIDDLEAGKAEVYLWDHIRIRVVEPKSKRTAAA